MATLSRPRPPNMFKLDSISQQVGFSLGGGDCLSLHVYRIRRDVCVSMSVCRVFATGRRATSKGRKKPGVTYFWAETGHFNQPKKSSELNAKNISEFIYLFICGKADKIWPIDLYHLNREIITSCTLSGYIVNLYFSLSVAGKHILWCSNKTTINRMCAIQHY